MAGTLEERLGRPEDESRRLEDQKVQVIDAINVQQAINQNVIEVVVNDAKAEFMKLNGNMQTLYNQTAAAVEELQRRLTEVEKNLTGPMKKSHTGYLPVKAMTPEVFSDKMDIHEIQPPAIWFKHHLVSRYFI